MSIDLKKVFNKSEISFNEAQKQAIKHVEGPLLIGQLQKTIFFYSIYDNSIGILKRKSCAAKWMLLYAKA